MHGKTIVTLQGIISDLTKSTPTPSGTSDFAQKIANGTADSGSTAHNFFELIGLVFLLIIIMIAAYYTSKFIGGVKLGQMKKSNFTIIDTYRISQNKVIQIVKIANKYVVIAIGKDTITSITELDEAEVYIKEFDEKAKEKISFKQTLDKLRNINK